MHSRHPAELTRDASEKILACTGDGVGHPGADIVGFRVVGASQDSVGEGEAGGAGGNQIGDGPYMKKETHALESSRLRHATARSIEKRFFIKFIIYNKKVFS